MSIGFGVWAFRQAMNNHIFDSGLGSAAYHDPGWGWELAHFEGCWQMHTCTPEGFSALG